MKRLLALIITALVLVSAIAVSASAYGRRQNAECRANGTGFVDADNDGICDNKPAPASCNGADFTDEDGDGFCDNRAERQNRQCAKGNGFHCGRNR